ncbi:SulP family inorganic anion transporter [Armatimonas rosea]|uniref:Carbonic anhydrase n=1 Tax=Armatimonas rosea TaxID=685828 RepID=A0A7W9W7G4_ARMRO|nr:SulP family inorganic anion transporter [Armatimonas rosea]MBB6051060.1 carbonic anhydrase [Armatimonas rosea]
MDSQQTARRSYFHAADLPASLVVFLVAVPLALGIANASGAPIASGLIGCIVGGIVAGLVGGAPLQVSGPAAGLTVLVFGLVQKFGWTQMCAISLAAGVIQLCFGALRIARACLLISPAVVHGMLAGIGVTIALAQFHVMLGGKPRPAALLNLKAIPYEVGQLLAHPTTAEVHAAVLGVVTIAILIVWGYLPARVRLIPGALVSVLVATVLGNLFFTQAPRVAIKDGSLFQLQVPQLPADLGGFFVAALTIAVVASVESLLCAVATDKLHSGPRANLDRELIGQGAANALSGLLGGLPVTGVIVRSAANVTAGAKTQGSAVLHGLWIVLFVLVATPQLNKIPLAALAGLLIHVGVRLVNLHHIKELHLHREVVVYLVTALGVAFVNLLAGVGLGMGLALLLLLRRLAYLKIQVESRSTSWHVAIQGALNFLSMPQLTAELAKIPSGARVDVDLQVEFMDHAAFEALHSWRHTHEKSGGVVDIDERHEAWYGAAKSGQPRVKRD